MAVHSCYLLVSDIAALSAVDTVVCHAHLIAGGADNNKGRSKKWKKILAFPHISECIGIKDELGKS